ncbi:MAG: hypothetical protein ACE5FQ_12640 [Thiogranum sp.]
MMPDLTSEQFSLLFGHDNYVNFWNEGPDNPWKVFWDHDPGVFLMEICHYLDHCLERLGKKTDWGGWMLGKHSLIECAPFIVPLHIIMSGFYTRDRSHAFSGLIDEMKSPPGVNVNVRWWSMILLYVLSPNISESELKMLMAGTIIYSDHRDELELKLETIKLSADENKRFIELLKIFLGEDEWHISNTASEILLDTNDSESLRAIIATSKSNSSLVRDAISALKMLNERSLYPELGRIIETGSEYVARDAIIAAEEMTGKRFWLFKKNKWIKYLNG